MQTHPAGLTVTCAGTWPRPLQAEVNALLRVPVSSRTSPSQPRPGRGHCPCAGAVGAGNQAEMASCRPQAHLQRQFSAVGGLWGQSLWFYLLVPLAAWPRVSYFTSLSLLNTAAIHRTVDSRSDCAKLGPGAWNTAHACWDCSCPHPVRERQHGAWPAAGVQKTSVT